MTFPPANFLSASRDPTGAFKGIGMEYSLSKPHFSRPTCAYLKQINIRNMYLNLCKHRTIG